MLEVWHNLIVFINEVRKYLAACNAINNYEIEYGDENEFLSLSKEIIEREIFAELGRIFDRDKTHGIENNSINLLKALLEDKTDNISEGYVFYIENLYKEYNAVISLDVRNKKIAHHDLGMLKCESKTKVPFAEIKELVDKTTEFLRLFGETYIRVSTTFVSIDELEALYRSSIDRLKKDKGGIYD